MNSASPSALDPAALEHFRVFGWVRVAAAFDRDAAAAMCAVIWSALAKVGIQRDDPATWTKTRPEHLQYLKSDPAFRAIGSERTIAAIREVLEHQRIDRFHERVETVDGIPLQVAENTASAGDVILMHSLLLHAVPAAHVGTQPRLLVSSGIREPYW